MDLRFTPEEIAFRDEVRAFIRDQLPADTRRRCVLEQRLSKSDIVDWQRALNRRGWAVPHWPAEWGGLDWTPTQLYIFREELQSAPAPEPLSFNVNMVGPVIITFGTPAQKERFLPRIRNLDWWFCQGFSEPGSGSDLASLRTAAKRDGDHYVINGQKIWTSKAQYADWMFCLVRTDPDAPKRQDGITYLLIDMKTPGITVRPILTIDRQHHFNEVFFDDVRVPVGNRIGEENKGWSYAKYLLSNERGGQPRVGVSKYRVRRAKDLAREIMVGGRPLAEDPRFREKVAALEVELKALEMTQMRVIAAARNRAAGTADPASSILKIKGTELQQATTELLMEVAGPFAAADQPDLVRGMRDDVPFGPDWAAATAPNYFFWRELTIAGGSTEIQKNIVSKGVLGLGKLDR
jgi:pimeloyl-CoA dehydrogenase large subunit